MSQLNNTQQFVIKSKEFSTMSQNQKILWTTLYQRILLMAKIFYGWPAVKIFHELPQNSMDGPFQTI